MNQIWIKFGYQEKLHLNILAFRQTWHLSCSSSQSSQGATQGRKGILQAGNVISCSFLKNKERLVDFNNTGQNTTKNKCVQASLSATKLVQFIAALKLVYIISFIHSVCCIIQNNFQEWLEGLPQIYFESLIAFIIFQILILFSVFLSLFTVFQRSLCHLWILWPDVNEHPDVVLWSPSHVLHHTKLPNRCRCAVRHPDAASIKRSHLESLDLL